MSKTKKPSKPALLDVFKVALLWTSTLHSLYPGHERDGGDIETDIAGLKEAIELAPKMLAALKKAEQLATIASDWNLDEVEIDNEMVSTLELQDEFTKLIKLATV